MPESITDIIKKEFDEREKITLKELYELLSKNPNIGVDHSKLKHRIRSTLYSLKHSNNIKRVGEATYEKIS